MLGDALRALLLDRGQGDWDLMLPHLMRAFRGTPHTGTDETANMLMLGREFRLPDLLLNNPPPCDYQVHNELCAMNNRMSRGGPYVVARTKK